MGVVLVAFTHVVLLPLTTYLHVHMHACMHAYFHAYIPAYIRRSHSRSRLIHAYILPLPLLTLALTLSGSQASENVNKVLVGNKCDMLDKKVVETSRGQALADEFGIKVTLPPQP